MRTCVTYLLPTHADVQCSSCCGTTTTDCDVEWSWGAVLATLSVSAVFATCSGILALAEKHRKRKGMSLARAWSLPQGMPVVRAGNRKGVLPVLVPARRCSRVSDPAYKAGRVRKSIQEGWLFTLLGVLLVTCGGHQETIFGFCIFLARAILGGCFLFPAASLCAH